MFKRNAMGNTRTKIVASAVLLAIGLSAAGSAMSTDVWGGGATLPAGAYVGFGFLPSGKMSANTVTAPNSASNGGVQSTSLFGVWSTNTGDKVAYCQTGSGGGKKIFDNWDPSTSTATTAVGVCDGTTLHFGAPTGLAVNPYFAGSDAPMSSAEYDAFATGGKVAANGEPVQFPAVIGSIAIAYHKDGLTSQLNLSDTQICSVFNGTFTDWRQLGWTPANPSDTTPAPIKVVFRSDGSGTTFSLMNHLTGTGVCSASTAAKHFVTDQSFAVGVSLQFTAGIPSNWSGVSGNPAVIKAINDVDGTFGYAESANLKAAGSTAANVNYALVNGKDPYADLQATTSPISVNMLTNQVITGVNASTGVAVLGSKTPLVAGTTCLGIVSPASYATSTTRYPIIAVSYLISNNKGNGAAAASVKALYSTAYNPTGVTTIGQGTGYAPVSVVPAVNAAKLDACINI